MDPEDFINFRTSISELICGSMRGRNPMTSRLKSNCSPLGLKIATSLVKIASTRIFAQPEQSLLELPVNSIDSYGISSSVGKFGMGFFSFLYWLVDHPSRFIEIISTYRENNGSLFTWRLLIYEREGIMDMEISKLNGDEKWRNTGTEILLDCHSDPLAIDNFLDQIRKLEYVESANIYCKTENGEFLVNERGINEMNLRTINITLSDKMISNIDYAKGISLDVLFGSLLIPSISTKGIHEIPLVPSGNEKSNIYKDDEARLLVLVGSIAVVSISIPTKYTTLVAMKPNTPIPVSRDDVMWQKPEVAEEFFENLRYIRDEVITSVEEYYPLKIALENYKKYSPASSETIDNFMKETKEKLEMTHRYFVPQEYYHIYKILHRSRFIPMDEVPSIECEKYMRETYVWKTNIFYGKYVMFLSIEENITTADTSKFLFLNSKYENASIASLSDLAISFSKEYLMPVKIEVLKNEHEKIKKATDNLDINIRDAAYNYITQFLGLKTCFNFRYINEISKKIEIPVLIVYAFKFLESISLELVNDVISLSRIYMNRIANGRRSYGMGKPYIEILGQLRNEIKEVDFHDKGKIANYTYLFYKHFYSLLSSGGTFPIILIPPFLFTFLPEMTTPLINKCFENSQTVYEFIYLLGLLEDSIISEEKDIFVALNYWREHLNNASNRKIIIYGIINTDELETYIKNPLKILIGIYKQNRKILKKLPNFEKKKVSGYIFKLSSVISFLFQKEDFQGADFIKRLGEIKDYSQSQPLQVIEIAINEGTVREFTRASLIETFQNSIDAMRMANIDSPVSINIQLYGEKSIALSISDPVGMSSDNLLHLSVPFLSTKKSSSMTVGEMGSGWFSLYRESDFVQIETSKDGVGVIAIDTPIKMGTRAVDVKREISVINRNTNGTTITLVFTPKNAKIYDKIGEMVYFIQSTLALSHKVILNEKSYEVKKELIFNDERFEAYSCPDTIPSWVLTKGIPFAEFSHYAASGGFLPDFLISEASIGYVLNIKHSVYVPMQTRAKIRISKYNEAVLKDFLLQSIYIRILKRYLSSANPDFYIPNTQSHASLNQLFFSVKYKSQWESVPDFILGYRFEKYTIEYLINYMIDIIDDQDPRDFKSKIPTEDETVREAVYKWLYNKSKSETESITKKKTPQGAKKRDSLFNFIKVFISVYWDLGKSLEIQGTDFSSEIPSLAFESLSITTEGKYNKWLHAISLNNDTLDNLEYEISKTDKSSAEALFMLFTRNETARRWIGIENPSSVLIHELSHAWRKTSHEASHQPIMLNIDGKNKKYDFDEAANVVYKKILEKGFISKIMNKSYLF